MRVGEEVGKRTDPTLPPVTVEGAGRKGRDVVKLLAARSHQRQRTQTDPSVVIPETLKRGRMSEDVTRVVLIVLR